MKLESRHEAAFNALGETLVEFGISASLGFTPNHFAGKPYFTVASPVPERPGVYTSGGSDSTFAEAALKWAERMREELAKPPAPPPLSNAAAVKSAAKELIDEARKADVYPAVLDELAERIDALQVRS